MMMDGKKVRRPTSKEYKTSFSFDHRTIERIKGKKKKKKEIRKTTRP